MQVFLIYPSRIKKSQRQSDGGLIKLASSRLWTWFHVKVPSCCGLPMHRSSLREVKMRKIIARKDTL